MQIAPHKKTPKMRIFTRVSVFIARRRRGRRVQNDIDKREFHGLVYGLTFDLCANVSRRLRRLPLARTDAQRAALGFLGRITNGML